MLKWASVVLMWMVLAVPQAMAQEPFIGEMRFFAGNFAPRGWALCDGQLLPISQYSALFSILGTTYGGDGRTTFALPDMRSRSPIHPGTGPGLPNFGLGERSGQTEHTTVRQHSHSLVVASENATTSSASGGLIANASAGATTGPAPATTARSFAASDAPTTTLSGATVQSAGSPGGENNYHPTVGVNCIIALQGLYPSRS